jgi:hypothetical protein
MMSRVTGQSRHYGGQAGGDQAQRPASSTPSKRWYALDPQDAASLLGVPARA